jgi:diguanylate cyclase
MLGEAPRLARNVLLTGSVLTLVAWIEAAAATGPARGLFFDNAQWTFASAAGTWLAWRGSRAASLPEGLRRARRFFTAGMFALVLGQITFDIQSWVGWLPFPGPSDVFFILLGPAFFLGFTGMLRDSLPPGRRRVVLLDLAGFALAVLALTLTLYVPLARHSSSFQLAVFVAYPVLLLSTAAAALVTHLHLRLRWVVSWQVILIGLCVEGLVWMIWNRGMLNESVTWGTLLSGGFSIGSLTLGWGSAVWRPQTDSSKEFDRACEGVLRQLPLLTVALAVASIIRLLALDQGLSQALRTSFLSLGVGALLLAIVRQTQQLAERDRLIEAERVVAESRAKLEYLAHHDSLTGLPNRALLRERVQHALSSAEHKGLRAALMFIDFDQFKQINDTLGHATGDALLCQLAQRLKGALHWSDTVSRHGGDEFTVVVADAREVGDVVRVAEKLAALSGEPVRAGGYELPVSMSIGIALYPDDGLDFESLLQCADTAMYRAKAEGRNGFRFYDAQMQAEASDRLRMRICLSHAIEREELQLHYQPQIDLETGAVCGVEALLRWASPELGSVPPALFIPVAEESGLIIEIGGWVLREACRQAAAWRGDGAMPRVPLAVNVSVLQFHRGDLEHQVREALRTSRLPPQSLELELTESVLMRDQDRVIATIGALSRLGVRFAIDDFGTGYCNMGYLRRLPVGKLKIDKTFVHEAGLGSPGAAGIVRAMIDMARALDVLTVAEGVETREQAELLRSLRCDIGQGFFYTRPLDRAGFTRYAVDTAPTQPEQSRAG